MNKNLQQLQTLCDRLPDGKVVRVMEVCGTHTMAIASSGLRSLLPANLKLTSGPGCPVCVTDQAYIDCAVALAESGKAIIATYGDMVRVPGGRSLGGGSGEIPRAGSLADARARGAEVEVVYSADQAVDLAVRRPGRQVVFLAVGFETTAPGTAMAVLRARRERIDNFSVMAAHKLITPAMRALLSGPAGGAIDAFLCPGHVSVIVGWQAYEELVADFARPCVVAGFSATQILAGLVEILDELSSGRPRACTVYPSVSREGNTEAQKLTAEVFVEYDAPWRALGVIVGSGLKLREQFGDLDAAGRFEMPPVESYDPPGCRCGDVICGLCSPTDCTLFGGLCTPRDPVGPCMVSSEGACAAAYKYQRPAQK